MGALKLLCKLNKFIVADSESEDAAKLEDLELLSNLQGKLTIELPMEGTLREGSGNGKAIMLNKKELRRLKIEWPQSRNNEARDLGNGDMDIMAKLQPHSDLEVLKVYYYEGLRFPPWEDALGSLSLVTLKIVGSTRCQHLPSFSKLPCLKSFTIYHWLSLEYMEENVPVAGAPFFPSLKHFQLWNLPELKGWCRELAGAEQQFSLLPSFPHHLAELNVNRCPKLKMTSMPPSPTLRRFCMKPFLAKFSIPYRAYTMSFGEDLSRRWGKSSNEDDNDLVVSSSPTVSIPGNIEADNVQIFMSTPWEHFVHGNPSTLSINGIDVFDISPANMIDSFFERMSKCITSLEIIDIPHLKTFPKVLRHLTTLRDLHIANCHNLTGKTREASAPEITCHPPWKGFESLIRLSLQSLPKLMRLPKEILSPTSLVQVLDIQFCPKLKVFPTEASKLIDLKYLCLSQRNYSGVKSLFMGCTMSNLTRLDIRHCRLESPPLQSLCQYQWLKLLKLSCIQTLEYIQDDNSAAFSLPSLERIWL